MPGVKIVLLDGSRINSLNQKMGMIFQEYSILHWLTVTENVSLGLDIRKVPEREREEKVDRYLSIVGIQGVGDSHLHELSGGMRQG